MDGNTSEEEVSEKMDFEPISRTDVQNNLKEPGKIVKYRASEGKPDGNNGSSELKSGPSGLHTNFPATELFSFR